MPGLKRRAQHAVYLSVLRRMSPKARLRKAFELSTLARTLFRVGLDRRFAHLSQDERDRLLQERLQRCHNRNF